jgi:truncated hemoglobin YjbI
MEGMDLYQAAGGRDGCRRLSESFYARVKEDPVLRPFFPGKSMRCAVEQFAAFLAQLLGGPPEDAENRWWLSLRESHLRFQIGPKERDAWMNNMLHALGDAALDEPVRGALCEFFERSSAYVVNDGPAHGETLAKEKPAPDPMRRALTLRWDEQRALDDLTAAIRQMDAPHALKLTQSPALKRRFSRDRAILSHALALMMATNTSALLEFVARELRADPSLAKARNRHGRTLLHDAAAQGNSPMVELLLALGADPNVRTAGGHTPLYCVGNQCWSPGGGAVVRALVSAGAHVDAPSDSKRCTALHMAARRGNAEVAAALLDCGANLNARDKTGVTPLGRARNCRKGGVVALLEARGAR